MTREFLSEFFDLVSAFKKAKLLIQLVSTSAKKLINIATFIMLFHYFFTLYLSLVYPVNHFYVFPVLQKSLTKRSRSNVKFSLYLKKAGLASRNIVRT